MQFVSISYTCHQLLLTFSCTPAVKFEEILPKGMKPRFLEDEGIYVCEKIQIPRKMYDKMSHRLLNQTKVISQAMHFVFEKQVDFCNNKSRFCTHFFLFFIMY